MNYHAGDTIETCLFRKRSNCIFFEKLLLIKINDKSNEKYTKYIYSTWVHHICSGENDSVLQEFSR